MPEKPFEGLLDQLAAMLPGRGAAEDAQKSARALLEAAIGRLDLVTRDDFDAQAAVLARTRARVEELEQQLDALNEKLDQLHPQD